ncbi:Hypothetical predicted protein [Cloeon dipterum]|uniref:Anaphase-promoting complex subunit 7 n=1 Tax=Cloeon dipterum TaxID=197152 RepID=A0A8S1DUQ6_9INSE|nr:Hypothetical predicted protein [Cloeon dipterum]
MTGLAEQIKHLYDAKLYSNVVALCNIAVPACDNNPEVLGIPHQRAQTLVVYGDSLLRTGHPRKAESVLEKALLLRKCILKPKGATLGDYEVLLDVDIKYLIHECRVCQHDGAGAISILETVSAKARNPRVNMALGKLYAARGLERSAITAYKEVLKEAPLAIEAAEQLLRLGVSGAEVMTLMVNGYCRLRGLDWVQMWMRALGHLHQGEYSDVITALKSLDNKIILRGCSQLTLTIGRAYYLKGDYASAIDALQKVQIFDPTVSAGLDVRAHCLYREKRTKELEKLVAPLADSVSAPMVSPCNRSLLSEATLGVHGPEVWVAVGWYALARSQPVRANHLAARAKNLCLRDSSVEALLLRGAAQRQLKRLDAAIACYRDVLNVAPKMFEAYEGLINCYLAAPNRKREAFTLAATACRKLNHAPRALTLYAQVLMNEPGLTSKAKSALEKALNQDAHFLPAAYLLAEMLEKEHKYDHAIALLQRHIDATPNAKLHSMIGDLHSRVGNVDKALSHFTLALNFDPKNRVAQAGIDNIDCAGANPAGGASKPSPCFLSTPGADDADMSLDVEEAIDNSDTDELDEGEGANWPEIS